MGATQDEKNAYKLMRRGTRACSECRRRKIKCTYDGDNHEVCQECAAHNRGCVKQGLVRGSDGSHSNRTVKIQVTRLESAVEKLARETAKAATSGSAVTEISQRTPESDPGVLVPFDEELKKRSPIFSLFNNEIDFLEAFTPEFANQISFPKPDASDKEKLLSTIVNVPDIFQVLDFASDWWISWREQHFALRKTAGNQTLHDFVQAKLAEDAPAAVALGLMAIAMALGQLRPGVDDLKFNLPVPANHIMNYIMAAVDQVVCDSEKYQSEPDIILVLIMRAKHHTEINQLRKSWLRVRQAIRCAQIMGFCAANPTDTAVSNEEAERQRVVGAIFEIERLIAMVLGFPYTKDPAFTDVRAFSILLDPSVADESLKMRALRRVIAVAAGHISDRNGGMAMLNCDKFTENTQATLNLAANSMPPGWWNILTEPMPGVAVFRYESLMVQMWFWTVQAHLHMPYLIKPSDEGSAATYRQLCMNGTRNLLRSFNHLRADPAVSVFMCNCDDFQALIGACILLVGTLQDVSKLTPASSPIEQLSVDSDLALIEELKDIFRYRMHEQGGSISKQGLAVLEELTCFLYDEDDGNTSLSNSNSENVLAGMNIGIDKHQRTIMLPYFGTITLQLTRKLPKRRATELRSASVPTPPQSVDGSVTNNASPSQDFLLEMGPVSDQQTALSKTTALATDSARQVSWPTTEPESVLSFDGTNISYSLDQSGDPLISQTIAWDSWESYMFDQELERDWNPGLGWNEYDLAG